MVILRRTGWTAQNALRPLLAVLTCLAVVAAGCTRSEGLRAGDAATFLDGSSGEISVDGKPWEARGEGDTVPDGARVRAGAVEARLALRDGTVALAPGAAAVITAQGVRVDRGDALVDSDGALSATVADTTVVVSGIVRVAGGLAARVGVYEGSAAVRRPAQERQITALRQLDLAAFRLAPAGEPLRYREDDPWDQDLLGEAIAFDRETARLARGLDIELGTRPQRAAFYREFARPRVLPALATAAPVTRGRAFGPPSDVLLTMFVAQVADGGRLDDRVRQIAALRRDGARWGLIAMEFGVASDALVAAVDSLDSSRLALADRTPADATLIARGADPAAGGTAAAQGSGSGASAAGGSGGGSTRPRDGSPQSPRDGGGDEPKDPGDGDDPEPPPPGEEPTVEKVVSDVVSAVEGRQPDPDEDTGLEGLPRLP